MRHYSPILFIIFWIHATVSIMGFQSKLTHVSRLKLSGPSKISMTSKSDQYAILFDCDGVIVETEELHRVAYNQAFQDFGLILPSTNQPVIWDTDYYDKLQNTIGGGKPKMKYYFNQEKNEWPIVTKSHAPSIGVGVVSPSDRDRLVDELQNSKTNHYLQNIASATARPGVIQMIDDILALRQGRGSDFPYEVKIGICSASSREGFEALTASVVGIERLSKIDVIIAGDDVSKRKPHPMIYEMASNRLAIHPSRCVVIEDSLIGLAAAKGAGMKCLITYTTSTAKEDFYGHGADAKIQNLSNVKLHDIINSFDDLLHGKRD